MRSWLRSVAVISLSIAWVACSDGDPVGGTGGRADAGGTGGSAGPSAGATARGGEGAGGAPADAGAPVLPETLAETGLYEPGSTTQLAAGVSPYAPRYELWSDAADKQRFLRLPEGARIDTSDMDAWRFPLGTKIWKEFRRDGKRLETRLLWKLEQGWYRMAFTWNEAETEALAAPRGQTDVRGTEHDVPSRSACVDCHENRPDFVLGVSAIQLSHEGPGLTLNDLREAGRLSHPPATAFALPETPAWDALGYLHANCGNCHNPHGVAWDRVDLDLWLRTAELGDPSATRSYLSSVGVALTEDAAASGVRVSPGDPDASGIITRMRLRGNDRAMPPLASERVDEQGVLQVSNWIEGL